MDKEQLSAISSEGSRQKDPKIELLMKHRLVDAQEIGRICPDETPTYIGNFLGIDIDLGRNSAEGIFEMTIEEKDDFGNFKGVIKDCYGDALVVGKVSDSEVSFIKTYIPEKSSVKASTKPISYESYRPFSDFLADYLGNWKYDGEKRGGQFWISDFTRNL